MKVGITPLAVHVPEIAPIRKSIRMAVVTSDTFSLIAVSNADHGVLNIHIERAIQTALAKSSAT